MSQFLQDINPNNRASVPGNGAANNIPVKSGDFNPVVNALNSIISGTGALSATSLTVSGDSSIGGDLSIDGDLSIGDDLILDGDSFIGGNLSVTGNILSSAGAFTLTNTVSSGTAQGSNTLHKCKKNLDVKAIPNIEQSKIR
jgi:hypothetical protein